MRSITILFIFNFLVCCGQKDSTLHFKDFGWTIKIPPGFTIADTATLKANDDFAKGNIKKAVGKEPNMSGFRHLITMTKGRLNSFSLNSDQNLRYFLNNWETEDSIANQLVLKVLSSQTTTIPDTSSSIVYIDGVRFKKYQAIYANSIQTLKYVDLATYTRGSFYEITYFFVDSIAGKEIENMINTSKFSN